MNNRKFHNQTMEVFNAFYSDTPKTMLQVAIETGILRANICWYVSDLKKEDRISLIKKGACPISKHRSGFYSTKEEVCNE